MTEALFTEAQCLPIEVVRARMEHYNASIFILQKQVAFITEVLRQTGETYLEYRDELNRRTVVDS